MKVLLSLLLVMMLEPAGAAPIPARRLDASTMKRQQLVASTNACPKGSDGVIVKLAANAAQTMTGVSSRMEYLKSKVQSCGSGVTVHNQLKLITSIKIRGMDAEAQDVLMADDEIESVVADCVLQVDPSEKVPAENFLIVGRQVQPNSEVTWGIDRIDQVTLPLDNTFNPGDVNGDGTVLYILDTGVRQDHNEFMRPDGTSRVQAGWAAYCNDGDKSECTRDCRPGSSCSGYVEKGVVTEETGGCDYHGSHCASSAAGNEFGVAKGATIVTVQVLGCDGWGTFAGIDQGIEWSIEDCKERQRIAPQTRCVISMSLGGSGNVAPGIEISIQSAKTSGIPVVVAAGNQNDDACSYTPAYIPAAITVAATDSFDDRAGYSNYGSCIDIYAPGSWITGACTSSSDCTATISGTSMATPHVAGVAALILSSKPSLTDQRTSQAVEDVMKCFANQDKVQNNIGGTANSFSYFKKTDPDKASCGLSGEPGEPGEPNEPGPTAVPTLAPTSGPTITTTVIPPPDNGPVRLCDPSKGKHCIEVEKKVFGWGEPIEVSFNSNKKPMMATSIRKASEDSTKLKKAVDYVYTCGERNQADCAQGKGQKTGKTTFEVIMDYGTYLIEMVKATKGGIGGKSVSGALQVVVER